MSCQKNHKHDIDFTTFLLPCLWKAGWTQPSHMSLALVRGVVRGERTGSVSNQKNCKHDTNFTIFPCSKSVESGIDSAFAHAAGTHSGCGSWRDD